MTNPRTIINAATNGQPNFMTPVHVESGWLDQSRGLVYEISTGAGFLSGAPLFGVTIFRNEPGRPVHLYGVSSAVESRAHADAYVAQLRLRADEVAALDRFGKLPPATDAQKLATFRAGAYVFSAPPVPHAAWDERDWVAYLGHELDLGH